MDAFMFVVTIFVALRLEKLTLVLDIEDTVRVPNVVNPETVKLPESVEGPVTVIVPAVTDPAVTVPIPRVVAVKFCVTRLVDVRF